MHLKRFKRPSCAEARDIQSEKDIALEEASCPMCGTKRTTYWNDAQTHKFDVCPNDEAHYKMLIDYIKDED
jgi:hypothetical protein